MNVVDRIIESIQFYASRRHGERPAYIGVGRDEWAELIKAAEQYPIVGGRETWTTTKVFGVEVIPITA